MKRLICFCAIIAIVAIIIYGQDSAVGSRPLAPSEETPLRRTARLAKERGNSSVVIYSNLLDTGVRSIEDLLTQGYVVVLVQPVRRATSVVDGRHILTSYKLKTLETLAGQLGPSNDRASGTLQIPREVLPSASDEMLLQVNGGTVTVDGISVVNIEEVSLDINNRYLIAVAVQPKDHTAFLAAGKNGVFSVNDDGILAPVGRADTSLAADMLRRYNNRLEYFREDMKRRQATP